LAYNKVVEVEYTGKCWCVSRAGKRLEEHGVKRGVTQHDAFSGSTE